MMSVVLTKTNMEMEKINIRRVNTKIKVINKKNNNKNMMINYMKTTNNISRAVTTRLINLMEVNYKQKNNSHTAIKQKKISHKDHHQTKTDIYSKNTHNSSCSESNLILQ